MQRRATPISNSRALGQSGPDHVRERGLASPAVDREVQGPAGKTVLFPLPGGRRDPGAGGPAGSDPPAADPGSAVIGAAGGTVATQSGAAKAVFPVNAAATNTTVSTTASRQAPACLHSA